MNEYTAKVDARLYEPKPLHYMFLAVMPDQFTWEYLEQGPEVWRVAIGKKY